MAITEKFQAVQQVLAPSPPAGPLLEALAPNTDITSDSEDYWFEQIRPDFTQSNLSIIAAGKKFILAKAALKGKLGAFGQLVERFDTDLGKVERLMKVARHPVLSKSAHAPILPVSWMTLYILAALPAEVMEGFIANGTIHPRLGRNQAELLVQQFRPGSNSGEDPGSDDDHGGDRGHHGDHDESRRRDHDGGSYDDADNAVDQGHGLDRDGGDRYEPADGEANAPASQIVAPDDIGPDSVSEARRLQARVDELQNELRRRDFEILDLKREIDELRVEAAKQPPDLMAVWRVSTADELTAQLSRINAQDFLQVMPPAWRPELERRVLGLLAGRPETKHLTLTAALQTALGYLAIADAPQTSKAVGLSQERAALGALRGIVRLYPDFHDLTVNIQKEQKKQQRLRRRAG